MNIHTVIHRLSWWHGDCKRGVMPLDLPALRAQFPSLAGGLAFFDGPGGTQTPTPVADAIAAFRAAFADLLGVPARPPNSTSTPSSRR